MFLDQKPMTVRPWEFRAGQIEKLVPQPQPAVAFGLLIWKDWPIRSSTNRSPIRPCIASDTGSTSTIAPASSMNDVIVRWLVGEIELVGKSGASATFHGHAKSGLAGFGGNDLADPAGG
jgi:hypothetical protein